MCLADPTTQGPFNGLAVSGTASPLTLATGAACVYGYLHFCTTAGDLTVVTPVVGTTGGHVVLRADWTAQTVRAVAVRNTDGVAATPSLTQTASTTWEIRLATFSINTSGVITVTDARSFAHFNSQAAAANIDDSAVTTAKINDSAVTTVKLNDGAVTTAKITDSNVTTAKIADTNVTTGKIANDAVDDTKAGDRVPQFYRRQGGSASNWSTGGTSTQTPGATRMQAGVITVGSVAGSGSGSGSVTFPTAFSDVPLLIVKGNAEMAGVGFSSVSSTGFNYTYTNNGVFTINPFLFTWFATGPE
jgi:hypothetical protein